MSIDPANLLSLSKTVHSVLNGINFWQNSSKTFDFILIHDAVRPCIRKSEIESLFKTLEDTSIDGAVLGTPCRETMKEVSSADNIVKRTVDRRSLWTAFTPQVFRKEALFSAFNNLEDKFVDFSVTIGETILSYI